MNTPTMPRPHYTARIVFTPRHQMDSCYEIVPDGFTVYLKNQNGDEDYLGKDGSFNGNVNSDRYAQRFVTEQQARAGFEQAFKRIYCGHVDPAWHSTFEILS